MRSGLDVDFWILFLDDPLPHFADLSGFHEGFFVAVKSGGWHLENPLRIVPPLDCQLPVFQDREELVVFDLWFCSWTPSLRQFDWV